MSTAKETAAELVDEAGDELADLLASLGHDGEEIREQARSLAALAVEVTASRLIGLDTAVAEAALLAAAKNLAAAASNVAAKRVVRFSEDLILRVAAGVVRLVVAAV